MNRITGLVASFSLLLTLSACGSSPPVRYYSLEVLETNYQRDSEPALALGIGPLRGPDYLSRSRIVTRGSDSEVNIDDFNRWVEPVDDALYRIVATNVDALLDGVVTIAFPYSGFSGIEYRVVGRINRFDADQDGRTVLLAQWGIVNADSEFVVQPRRARYEAQARASGDYSAIAAAMSEALQDFSRDIAAEFEKAGLAP